MQIAHNRAIKTRTLMPLYFRDSSMRHVPPLLSPIVVSREAAAFFRRQALQTCGDCYVMGSALSDRSRQKRLRRIPYQYLHGVRRRCRAPSQVHRKTSGCACVCVCIKCVLLCDIHIQPPRCRSDLTPHSTAFYRPADTPRTIYCGPSRPFRKLKAFETPGENRCRASGWMLGCVSAVV